MLERLPREVHCFRGVVPLGSRPSAKALDRHAMRADVAVVLCERDMFAADDHAASRVERRLGARRL